MYIIHNAVENGRFVAYICIFRENEPGYPLFFSFYHHLLGGRCSETATKCRVHRQVLVDISFCIELSAILKSICIPYRRE